MSAAELGARVSAPPPGITPESDCNSNNLANDVSFCSTSSCDFVQDNSDYQWFLEYGYRDQVNPHRSVLSLTSSREEGYYDELARNLDANLAEVEMEDFHSRDIHSILSTLQNDLQCGDEREMFASVSGSMMVKFGLDTSFSGHTSSQEGNNSASMCKSEPLFSPLKQTYLPTVNLSVDSLDLSDDMNILVTCQANKNNYTIAFEGSTIMGQDSDLLDNATENGIQQGEETCDEGTTMVRSDSMYTTWSQLKQQSRGSDNGNAEPETVKSQSMPDLYAQQNRCGSRQSMAMAMSMSSKLSSEAGSSEQSSSDPRTVKLYDVRKSIISETSTSVAEKASKPKNFSLVKLFMKQKGGSTEGMEQSSASDCWGENTTRTQSFKPETTSEPNFKFCRNINNNNSYVAGVDKACQTDGKQPVYVVYPNYSLPNLEFLKENHQVSNIDWSKVFFQEQKFTPPTRRRPVSMNDMERLKQKGFQHVQDWASLTFLLPKECKEFLDGIPEIVTQLKDVKKPLYNVTSVSSGYRGSSTMLMSNGSDETQPRSILREPPGRYNCKTAKDTANMRRLEELMEISTVFGDSSESVTESEMKKLRAQVSRFLSMQKELESVSERLTAKDACLNSSDGLKKTVSFVARGATPPNSPITQKIHQTGTKRLVEIPIGEECEGASSSSLTNLAPCLAQKKDLVQDVERSLEKVMSQYLKHGGGSEQVAQSCLQHLCPSLYAVLCDGLRETLSTPFGPIPNSVWAVVEASAQQGPMTRALHELVQRLNREFVLTEPLLKVNAFIFGLLNVKALDGWLSYLRTQEGLLFKHYESRGLLVLANAVGSVRAVVDRLAEILQPLSKVTFSLDLMHQAKILHRSLNNINTLLEATSSDGLLSPSKQLMLLKLVQSIQKSANDESSREDRGRQERKSSKSTRPRPRSGCELPSGRDVASAMKKRWSGVQLNSKLSKAFEQLGEELESEYTDSLDGPEPSSASKRLQFSDDTSQDISTTWGRDGALQSPTKDHKKIILSSLNKKGAPEHGGGGRKFRRLQQRWEQMSGRTDSSVSPLSSPEHKLQETDRRERCGRVPLCTPERSRADTTPVRTPERSERDGRAPLTTPSPTTRQSRIPRLVSSPVRPSTAPFPPTVTPRSHGATKKLPSPTSATVAAAGVRGVGPHRTDYRPGTAPSRASGSAPRPTSLPYRTLPAKKNQPLAVAKPSSMSLNRRTTAQARSVPKIVRTITHRLPSDSGHLSFNEGEKMRVVLEVDETYLLCCSGTLKGLVPKSAVVPVHDSRV